MSVVDSVDGESYEMLASCDATPAPDVEEDLTAPSVLTGPGVVSYEIKLL